MSAAALSVDPALAKGRKELLLTWFAIITFYQIYFIAFFILSQTQPPPKPWWDEAQIVQWFTDKNWGIRWGFAITFLFAGFTACQNALIAYSMRRMSISRAYSYSYLAIYTSSTFAGMLLACLFFVVGSWRLDRDPALTMALYDAALLSFQGTMGVFLIGSLVWMTAVLIDKNNVLPKWFGYFNLCNAFTEFVIVTIWYTRDGPFAWNGATAFWIAFWVFVIYTTVFLNLLRDLARREDFKTGALAPLAKKAKA
jgi:hypothetical protein